MAIRSPLKVITDYFGTQPPQKTQYLLSADAVSISPADRHKNKLGEGSYARVYRGQYNRLPCAVKVFSEDCLKKELSNPEHEFELAYLRGMNHENIVKVYGLWIDPHKGRDVTAIVMELCEDSLEGYIIKHKGKIASIDQKLYILNGVCKGMIFLHGENIVHGDLRPPNILLVTSEDQIIAKVSDFGMSRYIDPQKRSHLTSRHTDEEYLPPEVFHEKHQRTPKQKVALLTFEVDIFCFGTVALQLGCGEFPSPLKKVDVKIIGPSTVRTEIERRTKYVKKLKQSDREVIEPIVRRCLADKPDDRPTFTDLHATIEAKLKRYKEQPDLALLKEKITEVEGYRAMELEWKEAIDNVEKLKKVLKDKADVIQAKDELLREFETETNMQREKIESLAKEKNEAVIAHQANAELLQDELRDLRKSLTENAGQIARRDYEIEQLKLAQQRHQKEEEEMKQKLELAEQARKHALAEQQSDKDQLKKDLQEKNSALNALNEKLQKVLLEKKELGDVQAQLNEAGVRCQRTENEKEELKRSLQMSQDVIAKKAAESTEALEKLHTLETELAEQSKCSQKLEKEKQALLEKVSFIEGLNKEQNRQLLEGAAVAAELAILKRQVENKDKEVEALELARNDLTEQLANAQQQHEENQGAWAQAQQSLKSEIETLKKDAESSLEAKTAFESSKAKLEQENQKLQENLSAVETSLATISAQYSNQVNGLNSELQQKQLATESLASSLKTAQEQAARDERKLELFPHVCAMLRTTETKFIQASLANGALKKKHQAARHMCQNEVLEVTAYANRCQEEKNRVWREKEENEVAWRKEKEELQQSHASALKQKETDFVKEKKELESRHAKEMASTEEGIQQIRAALAEMESTSTQPPPSAKKGKRMQSCTTTQSALQDTNQRVNNLLREKSDWMEQQRVHDRTQKLLVQAEGKVTSLKDELQICERAKETLRTEKNDFMTRYQELLQQQKGWESAIADKDAAKEAMSQAYDEKDRLLKEHKELQDHCDKVNKRLLVVQHEKSQMAAKLQMSTLGNDAAGLISDPDCRDAEENDNALSGQEALDLRKQNEQLQSQLMELRAQLPERIASIVAEEQKVLIAHCEGSIVAMENKLKQVATFLPTLKVKCDSVASQMERLKDYHELKGMLRDQATSKDKYIQAKKELKEALNCAELKKVELHNVTRERDSLQHTVTDEKKTSAHLQEANLRLQNDVQEFEQKCKQRTQHMESYRTLLSEVSLEAESLHADRTKLEEELASAQSATGTLRERLSTVTQEMQQVSSERDVFRGAKEAHENTIRELVSKVEETEEGRKAAAEDLNHFKELYEQADMELSQARRTISDLHNNNQALQNANDEQKETLESIESKWTQSKQMLSALQVEKDNLQMQLTQVKEELELQISKMEKVTHEKEDTERNFLKMMQNQQLSSQRKITEIETERDEQCSHVATLRVTVSELQTELHSLRGASEKLQILQQRMASTEDQLAKVKAALLRSEETLVRERSEYAALQDKMQASLTSAHKDFEEKLKATKKKLTARNDDYGQLEDGHMHLQEQYQAQTKELQKMTDQYEDAIKQLHTLEVEKASLHKAFQEKADICVRLEEKTNRMAASKEAVKQQKRGYSQVKTELQKALQEVEVERAKLREREEQIETMKQTQQGMLARLIEQVHKSTSEAVKEHLQQLHEDSRRHVADRRRSEEEYWHQLQSQMQSILDKEQAAMVKMAEDAISVCETEKDTYRKELQAHTAQTQSKFVRDVGASVQAELSKVKQKLPERPIIPTAKDLLLLHTLANSCNPAYLLSSSKCVMPDEDLRSACDSRSIKCVFIGTADKLLQRHEICIPSLIRDFIVGAVEILAKKPRLHFCCTVPYVTFTKDVSLCNLLISQNAAACDGESRKLHLELEVALTQVPLLPQFSKAIKLQSVFDGTPFRPHWHGKEPGEEDSWAQAIQKVNKLPHELVNIFKVLSVEQAKAIRAILEKQLSYV